MVEESFTFKADVNMNALVETIAESLAGTIGVDPSKLKCKGVRIFFVEDDSQMLMSNGLFVKGFSPEDWDDKQ
jgi:hypothetical protein